MQRRGERQADPNLRSWPFITDPKDNGKRPADATKRSVAQQLHSKLPSQDRWHIIQIVGPLSFFLDRGFLCSLPFRITGHS